MNIYYKITSLIMLMLISACQKNIEVKNDNLQEEVFLLNESSPRNLFCSNGMINIHFQGKKLILDLFNKNEIFYYQISDKPLIYQNSRYIIFIENNKLLLNSTFGENIILSCNLKNKSA